MAEWKKQQQSTGFFSVSNQFVVCLLLVSIVTNSLSHLVMLFFFPCARAIFKATLTEGNQRNGMENKTTAHSSDFLLGLLLLLLLLLVSGWPCHSRNPSVPLLYYYISLAAYY